MSDLCKPPDDIRDTWIGRRVLELVSRLEEEERRHKLIDDEIVTIKSSLTDVNAKLQHILIAQDNEARAAAHARDSAIDVQRQILEHMEAEDKQRKTWYSNEDDRRRFSKRRYEYARWIFGMTTLIALLLFFHLANRWN